MSINNFSIAACTFKGIEIGIRQKLSAYMAHIISLLASNFSFFVILSFLMALPVAWFVVNNRIQDIAYRVSVIGWVAALSGVVILLIGLIILNIRTIRSALVNPVKSIRME
ncbi:MAG: hypothetical protein ACXWWC_10100 [Chitinophagaceae bacterium]